MNAVALVCGHLVVVVRGFGFTHQLIKEKGEERKKNKYTGKDKEKDKDNARANPKRRAKAKTLSSPRILLKT